MAPQPQPAASATATRRTGSLEGQTRSTTGPRRLRYAPLQSPIGYSVDVKQRMKSYPPHAELLAVHPGTKTLEREMHDQFRNVLAAGREWFLLAPELLDHIEQVTEQFGPPDPKHIYRFREGQPSQTMKLHRRARRGANQRAR